MFYPFKIDKAIHAAGVLLAEHGRGHMEYVRLLKLLYIADRQAIAETGRPIVGSPVVAMKNGPLHSRVYDLIKGEDIDVSAWRRHFQTVGVEIELLDPPGVGALSRYEIRKLKDVHEEYAQIDTWALVEETHGFKEWQENYPNREENTSRTIPFEDICKAVGLSDAIEQIRSDMQEAYEMDKLFR